MDKTWQLIGLAVLLAATTVAAEPEPEAIAADTLVERGVSNDFLGVSKTLNPYDPQAVLVDALFTFPNGTVHRLPCFWYVPMTVYYSKDWGDAGERVEWEQFQAEGVAEWRFRLLPVAQGTYQYRYLVTVAGHTGERAGGQFRVVGRPQPSGIVVDAGGTAFRHADGRPFIPIGQNLGWPRESGSREYEQWLQAMAAAGGNAARLWLTHFYGGTRLEWTRQKPNLAYAGVGQYNQEAAARVDLMLAAAGRHGVYLMLCFFSFGDLGFDWAHHPYNQEAGGWLRTPPAFFTDERARRAVMAQLRYAVARYGWSPQVWAWELWNEVETMPDFDGEAVLAWHREMVAYLRQTDVHRRLVTTSYRFAPPDTDCKAYELPGLDMVQAHTYSPDVVKIISARCEVLQRYGKPVVVGEFGLDVGPVYFALDPVGLHLHDGLWAGVFAGAAGTGMTWWWDSYVHPRNLYFHYQGISRFLADTDLALLRPALCSVTVDRENYFALALAGPERLLLWVGNQRQVNMAEVGDRFQVSEYRSRTRGGPTVVHVAGKREGVYLMRYYDPYDGVLLAQEQTAGGPEGLRIGIPSFRHDLAVQCTRMAAEVQLPPLAQTPTPIHDRFTTQLEAPAK